MRSASASKLKQMESKFYSHFAPLGQCSRVPTAHHFKLKLFAVCANKVKHTSVAFFNICKGNECLYLCVAYLMAEAVLPYWTVM